MKILYIVAGALCLMGCSSNSDSTQENSAVTPTANVVQPQIMATIAPPVVVATPLPTLTPAAPDASLDANALPPATGDAAPETVEEKQRKVASLRSDMSRLQDQRRATEEEKRQFGVRNPNADSGERALGADSPNDAQMAQYNARLDQIDSDISNKQKQIDDLMLSR